MDYVDDAVVALAWLWLAVCLFGVLGVALELLAGYVALVEDWLGAPVQRWLARRRS